MKESFTKKNQFIGNISDEILKKGNHFQSFKTAFLGKGYEDIFENFLNDYYESVGANLIPLTHYAKFIKILFTKGSKVLYKLLVSFVKKRTTELEACLMFLNAGEITSYRSYLNKLNWDGILEEF